MPTTKALSERGSFGTNERNAALERTETATIPEAPTRKKGGFSMPKNPALALQDAIRTERAEKAEEIPVLPEPVAPVDAEYPLPKGSTSAGVHADNHDATASQEPALGEVPADAEDDSNSALTEVRTYGSTHVSNPVSESVRTDGLTSARKNKKPSSTSMVASVKEALAAKRNHVGGVKATVDMSPELSLRLKRYLLDNGNPAARILMIELVTAFLAEEGY